jgi:hypothetical protein
MQGDASFGEDVRKLIAIESIYMYTGMKKQAVHTEIIINDDEGKRYRNDYVCPMRYELQGLL